MNPHNIPTETDSNQLERIKKFALDLTGCTRSLSPSDIRMALLEHHNFHLNLTDEEEQLIGNFDQKWRLFEDTLNELKPDRLSSMTSIKQISSAIYELQAYMLQMKNLWEGSEQDTKTYSDLDLLQYDCATLSGYIDEILN